GSVERMLDAFGQWWWGKPRVEHLVRQLVRLGLAAGEDERCQVALVGFGAGGITGNPLLGDFDQLRIAAPVLQQATPAGIEPIALDGWPVRRFARDCRLQRPLGSRI